MANECMKTFPTVNKKKVQTVNTRLLYCEYDTGKCGAPLMLCVSLTFLRPAFWDATRAFMLLAVLSCFAGVVLGLSAFTNGTKNRRVRTGGIALVLSGNKVGQGELVFGEKRLCYTFILYVCSLWLWVSGYPGFR